MPSVLLWPNCIVIFFSKTYYSHGMDVLHSGWKVIQLFMFNTWTRSGWFFINLPDLSSRVYFYSPQEYLADSFKSPNFCSKIDHLFSGRRVISLLISDSWTNIGRSESTWKMLVETRLTVKPQSNKVICQTLESISILRKNIWQIHSNRPISVQKSTISSAVEG